MPPVRASIGWFRGRMSNHDYYDTVNTRAWCSFNAGWCLEEYILSGLLLHLLLILYILGFAILDDVQTTGYLGYRLERPSFLI